MEPIRVWSKGDEGHRVAGMTLMRVIFRVAMVGCDYQHHVWDAHPYVGNKRIEGPKPGFACGVVLLMAKRVREPIVHEYQRRLCKQSGNAFCFLFRRGVGSESFTTKINGEAMPGLVFRLRESGLAT